MITLPSSGCKEQQNRNLQVREALNPGGEMQWKTKNFGNQDCQDLGKFRSPLLS